MANLSHSQINNNCKLGFPEGLRNLMYDISREVLRTQPSNLYQFIADYLSALLIARESLNVATHLCEYICNTPCRAEIRNELKNIDLTEEEATKAQNIIYAFLQKDKGTKGNLSVKLLEANIDKNKIPSIKEAVERTYKQKISKTLPPLDIPASYNSEEASEAAANTLKLYWKPLLEEEHNRATLNKGEAPTWQESHGKTVEQGKGNQKSSADNFDEVLRTIQYDGGIQDLYVSSDRSPYKNSSLTSLAGSYGLAKCKDRTVVNVLEEERRVVFYGDDETSKCNQARDKRPEKTQEHIELIESENNFDDEIMITVDSEINTDLEAEVIEDVALEADEESDSSVDEEFD